MEKQQTSIKERENIKINEPRRYKVVIHNDDFTTMDFVVKILVTIFYKSTLEAEALMMLVHKTQSAVVGIYSYDIAKSKTSKAMTMARNEGFPLRLTITPEDK
ncbi:MAG: ATP-dependent Clp protease adaptor ClpS [Bacteroidaceae bacterium]|nr:ATP-dependent Clp protease adaptor ClpS [Bacteroidaceae bacterium]MBR5275636.1 ATP-dependent Clp protease adaptor ClpS [Bacteroidaceae bacterium]MBR5890972.1 ATP-dependent Clp protease adaptor ClpS [Bacteroidaceae bacterium]